MSVLIVQSAMAVPVDGEVFDWHQPDGTPFQVRIWGDEFYQVVESMDGYTLTRDPESGLVCYARLSEDGDALLSTGVPVTENLPETAGIPQHIRVSKEAAMQVVNQARARFQQGELQAVNSLRGAGAPTPAPPCVGDVKGICLIIDFSDDPGTIASSEVDALLNQQGYSNNGNNGSVRDYFYDVSDGVLTYTNDVPANYYRASQPKSYYNDSSVQFGTRARELVLEALNDLESQGHDFSQYDSNGDNIIDAINVFYAGEIGVGWSVGLWPHSWTINFSADGVDSFKYQMTNMGSTLTIGTFCHENGHQICYYPDLYDYGYESNGVGKFCLMCYNFSTNPQEICAFLKEQAGWVTATELTVPQNGLSLRAGVNDMYKIVNPANSKEYFMIENRQATGRDAGIPDSGLAIWHVDEDGSNDNEQMTAAQHYMCTLVQADGRWDMEKKVNNGDDTDLWDSSYKSYIDDNTSPDTKWWDGSNSGVVIHQISDSGPTMTFTYGQPSGITVTPLGTYSPSGDLGGPFSPSNESYILTNNTGGTINWTATKTQSWLDLSSAGGSLNDGQTANIEATINAEANSLSVGTYSDTITFTDTTNGQTIDRNVSLTVFSGSVIVYEQNMDTTTPWTKTTGSPWEWGPPGGGGSENGNPTSAHTGTNIVGYNLDGDYENNVSGHYMKTDAIDCSNAANVKLTFWRWLGVEDYDQATIDVSNDGSAWTNVYENPAHVTGNYNHVEDTAWTYVEYDISNVADGQSTVYVRWGITSDYSVTYPGWNIDDVVITGSGVSEGTVTSFADTQPVSIAADNSFYAGAFNFTSSNWVADTTGSSNATLNVPLSSNEWTGLFIEDQSASRWVNGVYYFRQQWATTAPPRDKGMSPLSSVLQESPMAAPVGDAPQGAVSMSNAQTVVANGSNTFEVSAYNFSTSSWIAQESGTGTVSLNYSLTPGDWILLTLYDQSTGEWREGIYVYREDW